MRDISQKTKILMWTKEYEPITKREAIEFLDYFRLASCVCELKEQSLVKIRAVFVCYDRCQPWKAKRGLVVRDRRR